MTTSPIVKASQFDLSLLLRDVKGIEVEWMERYANNPSIQLILEENNSFDYFKEVIGEDGEGYTLYNEIPFENRCIYYADHPMGWVKFFTHCGDPSKNEGGYGGAPFGVQLHDGTSKVLRGPWSSRATVVNMVVSEDPDLSIVEVTAKGRYLTGAALKAPALVALLEHFEFPHWVLREQTSSIEKRPYAPSVSPLGVVKPGGGHGWVHPADASGIDILYSPK